MSAYFPQKEIIEILYTKLQESDFVLAEQKQIATWQDFENFIVLLGLNERTPNAVLQEIMTLRQNKKESLIDYSHRVERLAAEYNLSFKISNEHPMFTDAAFAIFLSKNAMRGLKVIYKIKLSDQEDQFTMDSFRTFCSNPSHEVFSHSNEKIVVPDNMNTSSSMIHGNRRKNNNFWHDDQSSNNFRPNFQNNYQRFTNSQRFDISPNFNNFQHNDQHFNFQRDGQQPLPQNNLQSSDRNFSGQNNFQGDAWRNNRNELQQNPGSSMSQSTQNKNG